MESESSDNHKLSKVTMYYLKHYQQRVIPSF